MKTRSQIEREALCRFIECAAIAIRAAAAVIPVDGTPVGLAAGEKAQMLGLAMGRLNAAVSGLMTSNVPDRDLALNGMAQEQGWWRVHLSAPAKEDVDAASHD